VKAQLVIHLQIIMQADSPPASEQTASDLVILLGTLGLDIDLEGYKIH
jgi:hypothetical protein